MAITVNGINLYRPTANISREYLKDNYGENIGVKDTVSITDIVTYQDNVDLISHIDNLLNFIKSTNFVDIKYNPLSTEKGRASSFEIDSESDFINKLQYTVTFEVCPLNVSIISRWPISTADGLIELNYSESINDPEDGMLIRLEDGKSYYNKIPTFTFNIQLSCANIGNNFSAKDNAIAAVKKLKKISPSQIIHTATENLYERHTPLISSVEESYNDNGSANLTIVISLVPPDSSSNVILESKEVTMNSTYYPNEYNTKQYQITFRGLANIDVQANRTGILTVSDQILASATSAAESIVSFFKNTNNGTPDINTPGLTSLKNQCRESGDPPALPKNSCYNTVSVGIEKNYSNGTATVIIDQTTEPNNCDGDGYVVDYTINTIKNKKTYAELFGWGLSQSIVQDLQCTATEVQEITVNVSSESKCLTEQLKTKAISKYEEIIPDESESTLIKHNLTINNGRCTIRASFIMSTGDSIVSN